MNNSEYVKREDVLKLFKELSGSLNIVMGHRGLYTISEADFNRLNKIAEDIRGGTYGKD
jgi:hypothetical protein